MTAGPLEVLLIEDNPGDARLVTEMVDSIGSVGRRFGDRFRTDSDTTVEAADGKEGGGFDVQHADRLADGLDVLDEDDIDIVLLDLNLPDGRGMDTLDAVLDHDDSFPVVVLTGIQDRETGLDALDHGAQEYLVKDEINADLLVRTIFHALQRARYERALERQHERLQTLYEISNIVQDIGGSLIDKSTRAEIESSVCVRLANSVAYQCGWIGEINHNDETVAPREADVPAGFFEAAPFRGDGSIDASEIGATTLTEEVQLVQPTDDEGPWRDHADTFEYRSLAAVPIDYDDALYGVLVVHADRPNAFEEEELDIVRQLGNVVGHAINAVERKAALMSDADIELELSLPDFVDFPTADGDWSGARIEFVATVPAGDGSYLEYADVEKLTPEAVEELFDQFAEFQDARVIDDGLIELKYADPPILATLATQGGRVQSARLDDGDYHVTATLPPEADVRTILDRIRESYPHVDLVAQRSVESTPSTGRGDLSTRDASLTEKQRSVLEAAYFSGYFNQPRRSTGEEVAESFDITGSTFHQHLQAGLRKLLAGEFEDGTRFDGKRS